MKKLMFVVIVCCFIASFAAAQENAEQAPAVEMLTLRGDIIDNMCADANDMDLANFVKTHTKDCATSPACAATGYSLVVDGKAWKFDKESDYKVEEFLRDPNSKLKVMAEVRKANDILNLMAIRNQD